jgi:uncharacterized protein YjaG (DUF416 family)
MEKQIIHVFIKQKPYRFIVKIVRDGDITTYQVEPDQQAEKLEDFIPDRLEFDVNGTVHFDERIRTAEGVEIAKVIWKGILEQAGKNKKPPEEDPNITPTSR